MQIGIIGYLLDAGQSGCRIHQARSRLSHQVLIADSKDPSAVSNAIKHKPAFCFVTQCGDFDPQPIKDENIFLVNRIPDAYGPEDE